MKKSFNIVFAITFIAIAHPGMSQNFPAVEKYKLKNGMEIIFIPYGKQPITSITAYVNSGVLSETPGMQSLSNMTAQALTLGNERYSRAKQDSLLALLGASLKVSVRNKYTSLGINFLNRDLETGLDLISSSLLHPSF